MALVSDKGEFVRTEPESSKQIDNSPWPIRCETGGEIFYDGTLIELVEDLQEENGLSLLKSDGGEPVFSPVVEHLDRTYVPVKLDRTFRQALRIPSSLTSYGSVESLKKNLLALTTRFTDLAEYPKQQLVSIILASWVADFLIAPLNVWLWSPSAVDGARLLELLHCLCRLPVLLSGASVADLRSLPDKLPATLLILRPASGRRMREWLAASGWRGFYHTRSGRLIQRCGVRIFSSDAPLGKPILGPVIEIPVTPSRRALPPLDANRQREIAELLPELLQFRVDYASYKRGESGESSDLGSWDPGELMEPETDLRDVRLRDPRLVLLEVLLVRCHEEGRRKIYVAEVAADLNAALDDAGATSTLGDRMVGSLLKSIGLRTRGLGRNGRGLKLDSATRLAIHRLAGSFRVASAKQPYPGFNECAQRLSY